MKSFFKYAWCGLVLGCLLHSEVAAAGGKPEVEVEDDVLVLNKNNFDHVLSNNKHVLVEFYAPWCEHCKELAPEYAKAASILKKDGLDVKLSKIDATLETALTYEFKINAYPTLKFFTNEKPIDYEGGRTAGEIVDWLKKQSGPPCKILNTDEEVASFKESNDVTVITHLASAGHDLKNKYENIASAFDDIPFGIILSSAVASHAGVALLQVAVFKKVGEGKYEKSAVTDISEKLRPWIIKETAPLVQEMSERFDEGRVNYTGDVSDEDALSKFIMEHHMPLVVQFTEENAQKIFEGNITVHNLLFISKKSGDFEKHIEVFKQAASEFRGKVLFLYIDSDPEDNKRVMEYFGLKVADVPTYRIVKMGENMAKFKPDTNEINKESIVKFTREVESGSTKRHLLSAEIPDDWNKNPVTVLVGKNFHEVVSDKTKKIFVEFYAPWCNNCKSFKPIWEKLGAKYKDNDNIIIAMMDATANEIEDFEIQGFPTLKFFPSGDTEMQSLPYNGDRTLEALVKFVESNGEKVSDGDNEAEEEIDEGGVPSVVSPPTKTEPPKDPIDATKEEQQEQEEGLEEEFDDELPEEIDPTSAGKDEL